MSPLFPVWEDGQCDHCGAKQQPDDKDPFYRYSCPGCHRSGCTECMPAGRGCVCPECEEGE